MPKLLRARPPQDQDEERKVRKLARARHAPGDRIARARMIARSWDGARSDDRRRARLPPPDGARAPGALRRRGPRRAGRPPRRRPAPPADRCRAQPHRGLGRHHPAGATRPPSRRDARGRRRAPRGALDARRLDGGGPGGRRPGRPLPGAARPLGRGRALAPAAVVGHERRSGLRPERTAIVGLYTAPPAGATVLCADELGPVTPRTFPPAPGWSPGGHRTKAPLEYGRGWDEVWVYGALRVGDGQAVTLTARSRNPSATKASWRPSRPPTPRGASTSSPTT